MKKIILASGNKVKKAVVEEAFSKLLLNEQFEVVVLDLEKDGSEPFGKEATLNQIYEATKNIRSIESKADFYVAMEGGVEDSNGTMDEVAYVVIEDQVGNKAVSQSVTFPVPLKVADKVRQGISFGDAVDQVHGTKNIKTGQGFVGLLTDGLVDKKALYLQPTIIALSKLVKIEWYS